MAINPFWENYLNFCSMVTYLSLTLQIIFFTSCCIYYLFISKTMSGLSQSTRRLQIRSFYLMILQILFPLILFIIPFSLSMNQDKGGHQSKNNFSIIMVSVHHGATSLSILLVHAPYRRFLKSKTSPSCDRGSQKVSFLSLFLFFESIAMSVMVSRVQNHLEWHSTVLYYTDVSYFPVEKTQSYFSVPSVSVQLDIHPLPMRLLLPGFLFNPTSGLNLTSILFLYHMKLTYNCMQEVRQAEPTAQVQFQGGQVAFLYVPSFLFDLPASLASFFERATEPSDEQFAVMVEQVREMFLHLTTEAIMGDLRAKTKWNSMSQGKWAKSREVQEEVSGGRSPSDRNHRMITQGRLRTIYM
uniref:Serpentine receptor class gamma n=1 Tax=Caenorhabditis tropicalis TaxID=1561998 RepID=A0A1I7U1M6_9PELO